MPLTPFSQSRRVRWTLALLALAAIVYLLKTAPLGGHVMADFRSFYFAGVAHLEGGNLYDAEYLGNLAAQADVEGTVYPYLYPPPLAFYMAPVAHLGPRSATTVWMLLLVVLGASIVFCSTRLCAARGESRDPGADGLLPLWALLLLVLIPFDNNLMMGQVNIVVLAFLTAALVQSLVYRRDFLAGLLLAPAALIKVTPLGLLLFFGLNRRFKVLFGCAVGVVVLGVPTMVTAGGLQSWHHFLEFAGAMGYGKTVPGLFSPAGVGNFAVAGWVARFTSDEASIRLWTLICLALLGLLLVSQHVRLRRRLPEAYMLMPYLVLMIISSPLAYLHHVIYIYPGLLVAGWALLESGERRTLGASVALVCLAAIASMDFPVHYDRLGSPVAALRSLNLYALLGLFGLGLWAPELCGLTRGPNHPESRAL